MAVWRGLFAVAIMWLVPNSGLADRLTQVLQQPVVMASDMLDRRIRDKFVYYENESIFVANRFLIETDVKLCIDVARETCTLTYYSKPELQKAAIIFFAYPLRDIDDVIYTTIRDQIDNQLIEVRTKRVPGENGLDLKVDVHRMRPNGESISQSSHWASVTPSGQFAGMRFSFRERITPQPRLLSLFRIGEKRLRQIAGSVVRIKNHYYSNARGRRAVRHGTGFFYRSRNEILTAWHNVKDNRDCRVKHRCELRFLHTDETGIKRQFNRHASIVQYNADDDFVLLRIETPSDVPARVLPIARGEVGAEAGVVGYPSPGFELLYSKGNLNSIAVRSNRLVASAYVTGGFSGAPVIDMATGKVYGLAQAWQRPRGQHGKGGPVAFSLIKVLEQRHHF